MVRTLLQVDLSLRPTAEEVLSMHLIKSLESDILPEYFKAFTTKGKSWETTIHRPIMLTRSHTNLRHHFPSSTYEVTYQTYLEDYKEKMMPDTNSKPYHIYPAHLRPKYIVPDAKRDFLDSQKISYELYSEMRSRDSELS